MKKKMIVSDVQSVFYKILTENDDALVEKRYLNAEEAQRLAELHKGKVVKVTKRMLETMEFEAANKK